MSLRVLQAGPAISVQDLGRPGFMANGLSCGGAADRTALIEGAALLGNPLNAAALEMAALGGTFEALAPTRIALTGAQMRASLDGQPLLWNASHPLSAGQILTIGPALQGLYGYLHVAGGFTTKPLLKSRAAHLAAGLGAAIKAGQTLPFAPDPSPETPREKITPTERLRGGTIRVLPSVHTASFSPKTLTRFQATQFTKSPRGNRQGVELSFDGAPFTSTNQLTILSQPMITGDIQMTGEGTPFVLLPECQTTGGYPRIATVLPDDLPKVAQATPGTPLRFEFIPYAEALALHRPPAQLLTELRQKITPLVRAPQDIPDLLSYQLISGAITGREP